MSSAENPAAEARQDIHTGARWSPDHVRLIGRSGGVATPLLRGQDFERIADDVDFWDAWPVQYASGTPAPLPDQSTLWMALCARRFPDPDERHGHARIHLLQRSGGGWRHLGPVMPDGFSPGSREWSGSAILDDAGNVLTLYFTAAGRGGEAQPTYEQRMFRASASLVIEAGTPRLIDWRGLRESVTRDPFLYMASDGGTGAIGTIKAFRDPAFFRDPLGGKDYLFFAASLAGSRSAFNGVVGAAVACDADAGRWLTLPPLISADGLNNELERPHVVVHQGFYYLFWSTQSHVFNPDGPVGPTGLYGMVSENLLSGWRPLNGSGLVFSNPAEAPRQAYSWFVMPDLQVTSFVDEWGPPSADAADRTFGGTFAPMLQIWLQGDRAGLVR